MRIFRFITDYPPKKYIRDAVSCLLTPSEARWATARSFLPSTANGGLTSDYDIGIPFKVNVGSK